jgi:hypothetical protein
MKQHYFTPSRWKWFCKLQWGSTCTELLKDWDKYTVQYRPSVYKLSVPGQQCSRRRRFSKVNKQLYVIISFIIRRRALTTVPCQYTVVNGFCDPTLLPYQLEAVRRSIQLLSPGICCLHMDLGSGKTLVAFKVAASLFATTHHVNGVAVYITLPSLVTEVRKQLDTFIHPKEASKWIITGSFKNVSVKKGKVILCVLDEYHRWKNHKLLLENLKCINSPSYLLMTGSPGRPGEHKTFSTKLSKFLGALPVSELNCMGVSRKTLVPPTRRTISLVMNTLQKSVYTTMSKEVATTVFQRKGLQPYLRLTAHRSIVSGWKVPWVVQGLQTCASRRVAIFSEFNGTLAKLAVEISMSFQHVLLLHCFGKNLKARQRSVDIFTQPLGPIKIILCNVSVASHGLNLGSADMLVLVDGFYKKRNMVQTIARLTRIGQCENQTVIQLIHVGTFEENIFLGNSSQYVESLRHE